MVETVVFSAVAIPPDAVAEVALDGTAGSEQDLVHGRAGLGGIGVGRHVELAQGRQLGGDLVECLVPTDRLPLSGAARAHALEGLLETVGIVKRLDARLTLQAQAATRAHRLLDRRIVCQALIKMHVVGVVWITVDLQEHAVFDLAHDPAAAVTHLTDAELELDTRRPFEWIGTW